MVTGAAAAALALVAAAMADPDESGANAKADAPPAAEGDEAAEAAKPDAPPNANADEEEEDEEVEAANACGGAPNPIVVVDPLDLIALIALLSSSADFSCDSRSLMRSFVSISTSTQSRISMQMTSMCAMPACTAPNAVRAACAKKQEKQRRRFEF